MKITIAYTSTEEREAARVLAALLQLLPGVRVHKAATKSPYIRIYLTTRKPGGS